MAGKPEETEVKTADAAAAKPETEAVHSAAPEPAPAAASSNYRLEAAEETIETKKMYSQVYSILNMLGETYKNKVPKKVLNVIENAKLDTYIPKYNPRIDLRQQDVMKESLAMIALIYMRCWCESEDEKLELKRMFD